MNKNDRQNKIIELISTKEIDTQEELVNALNALNLNVTQATVSRDVQEMGLIKISGTHKKRKYALPQSEGNSEKTRMLSLFKHCVTKIDVAQNIVVVKTYGGNGNSAGAIIDDLKIESIVGSVAGDDTVIVVTKTNEDALFVKNALNKLL